MPRVQLPDHLSDRPFTIADGAAAGLGRGRLRGGDLHRPTSGVRTAVELAGTVERAWAYALALPKDAVFSHVTAAEILGLPLPELEPGPLHVMRPTWSTRVRRSGCDGHRGAERRETTTSRGLPVTALADTWCDCAELLDLDDLVVLGDQVARRLASVEPVAAAISRRIRPRAKLLMETALPLIRTRSHSPMETRCRLMFVRAGLPEPLLNHPVKDAAGEWLATADFVWEEERVIGEYHGDSHTGLDARDSDASRRMLAQDHGWTYLEYFAKDVYNAGRRTTSLGRLARHLGLDPAALTLT